MRRRIRTSQASKTYSTMSQDLLRCANLLKLPDYVSYESLKSKVLQAIRHCLTSMPIRSGIANGSFAPQRREHVR